MKNILTTAGMAAVAVVGFQTTCVGQAVTVDDSKWWQVSAALRGFYDDNYTTSPKNQEQESFGVEVRPGLDLTHQGEQHVIKMSVLYSARWFEDRARNSVDHMVLADLATEYRLTENHVLRVNDTFSYTSEGTLLDSNGVITSAARTDGSNIRNYGTLSYIGQLTPLFGVEVGYDNTLYSYEDDSYSTLLDRLEHRFRAETRWACSPSLVGILGYWYEMVNFNGDGFIAPGYPSDSRDSDSHYLVAGVDYTLSPQAFLSARGGAQNVIYDDAYVADDSEWSPFIDVSGTYEYLEGSYVRAGGKYGRNRTDFGAVDQETGTLYGLVSHKLMENLTARLSGQLQFGEFADQRVPGADPTIDNENLYLVGLSLSYELSQYLAVEGGYNFDRVDSDDGNRTYSRNRVFLGVRGQF